tara:strand:- start:329 stop:673 length:345 start_codon:yes stop_codon:yes gene_type:complete
MATTTHLSMVRGDSKLFKVTVKDATGTVVNILGYGASFTVRDNPLDTTSVISKTFGSGITFTDASNGIMQIELSNTDTEVDVGKYTYDIEVVDLLSRHITVLKGNFSVTFDVTR